MSRILRALLVSAVATSAAVFATALLQNRDRLSIEKLKAGLGEASDRVSPDARRPSSTGRKHKASPAPVDSLTDTEQEMLLNELQDHV